MPPRDLLGLGKSQSTRSQPVVFVANQRSSWVGGLITGAVLLSATALTVGSAWIGIQLIFDPNGILWLNRFLPAWTPIPIATQTSLQTLPQIQASLAQAGLLAGTPIALTAKPGKPTDLLIPIWAPGPDKQLVELRVYSAAQPRASLEGGDGDPPPATYWANPPVTVAGPDKAFALEPLARNTTLRTGSTDLLPLTRIERLAGSNSAPGIWLNLTGQIRAGDTQITYGQLVHYNPDRDHLSLMLPWSSTTRAPVWQEVTGGGFPELVVEQTLGLEPYFKLYQIQPRNFLPNPIALAPISLHEPALPHRTYTRILALARSGLWSPAWQWMQSFKQQQQSSQTAWTETAQAQMDLMQWHARLTQQQAEQTWASPGQEILTNLIDGRWQQATQVYEATIATHREEILSLLKADQGRLGNRVIAALKVNPAQIDIKLWGALIRAAQAGKPQAIAWLNKQPKNTPATTARIAGLLNKLEEPVTSAELLKSPTSRIVGRAKLLSGIQAKSWFQPEAGSLNLESGQAWYQVQVSAFYDGKRWRESPFTDLSLAQTSSGQRLWNLLGLETDAQLQILVWSSPRQQETLWVTARALQVRSGQLYLLAAGNSPPETTAKALAGTSSATHALTVTADALQWLEPTSATISDLSLQRPQWLETSLRHLWSELQNSGYLPPGPVPTVEVMLSQQGMERWLVQLLDLTGNSQPEMVVTLDREALVSLQNPAAPTRLPPAAPPRTLIFKDSGKLIYSELGRETAQSLLAIANLHASSTNTLVVNGATGYKLQQWSAKKERFK